MILIFEVWKPHNQDMSEKTPHKSGFVNIIGNPNVGKSTLMNNLVGERISIITSKSQTTRHRIKGIVNGDDFQIVYSDTPGVLKPNYKLQESMMKFSTSALVDADIILYVTDVVETIDKNEEFLKKVQNSTVPVLLIINKIDLTDQAKLNKLFDIWKEKIPQAEIFPMSAKENFNVENLFNRILELLPEGEPYFAKDEVTDLPSKFFVTEIIREKVLMNYDKEVPYSVEIEVEEYKDEPKILRIMAIIYVERTSQKGIIIGHKGGALKKVGTEARMDIEAFFGKKVFLQLYVKVAKDWRSKDSQLKNFGYQK
jgi:GTP-binding protein Era